MEQRNTFHGIEEKKRVRRRIKEGEGSTMCVKLGGQKRTKRYTARSVRSFQCRHYAVFFAAPIVRSIAPRRQDEFSPARRKK